jgi:hypothetical protein
MFPVFEESATSKVLILSFSSKKSPQDSSQPPSAAFFLSAISSMESCNFFPIAVLTVGSSAFSPWRRFWNFFISSIVASSFPRTQPGVLGARPNRSVTFFARFASLGTSAKVKLFRASSVKLLRFSLIST